MGAPKYFVPPAPPAAGAGDMLKNENLSGLGDYATARTNLNVPSNYDSFSRIAAQLGGVKFDGVTSGQRATAFLGDWNIGTNAFSAAFLVRFPASQPSGNAPLAFLASSATSGSSTYGGLVYIVGGSDTLRFAVFGASTAGYAYNQIASIASYYGKVVLVTVVRSSGAVKIYLNTADSTLASGNTGTTPPTDTSGSIITPYVNIGAWSSSTYNDRIIRAALFNYALSAAEVATLYNDGILAEQRWVSYHGGNAILNVERNSTFAAAATDWTAAGTGTPTISAAGAIVFNAADDYVVLAATSVAQLTPGVLHKITFDVSGGTYGGNTATVGYGPSANNQTEVIGTITADGSYNWEFTPKHGLCAFNIIAVGGALNFTIDNVRVTKVFLANGNFETSSSATDFGSWTEGALAGGTVNVDSSVYYSGAKSCRMDWVTGSTVYFYQAQLTTGRKYRCSFWARHNKGSTVSQINAYTGGGSTAVISTDYTGAAISIPDSTWTKVTFDFTAAGPYAGVSASSTTPGNGKSLWIDDFEIIELGALDAWGPGGLDDLTTLWRSDNPSSGHDATLFNLTARADGTYQNIILGYGRGAGERGNLGRISRESGTMSLGGISLPGNANQRLTISSAPDISTNSFWVRAQFLCPASNPSSTAGGVAIITSSATAAPAANGFFLSIDSNGGLDCLQYGSTTSNYREVYVSSFVSRYGGRVVDLIVNRSASGSMTVWVNGSQISDKELVSGTPPTWSGSLTSTYVHVGVASTKRFIGEYYRFQVGRGVLTDAMVRQVYNAGIGTGTGGAGTTTPISRGGVMGSTDGVVIDLDLAPGAGNFFPDKSGNGYHAYSNLTDHTHKLPKSTGLRMYDKIAWTGTPTATKIGAGAVTSGIVLPLNAIIHRIVVKTTVATTGTGITIGDGSNATRYVLSTPIVSGYNDLPLNYTGSDGTNTTISVVPDSVNYTGTMHITVFYELADIV